MIVIIHFRIIDASVNNGINRVDSVTFDSKPATIKIIKDSLIASALADSRRKADLALSAFSGSILSIKDLTINDYQIIIPNPTTSYPRFTTDATAIETPALSVTKAISVGVTVTYLFSAVK